MNESEMNREDPFVDRKLRWKEQPPQEFYHCAEATRSDLKTLQGLVDRCASEKEIDTFLRDNPFVLSFCMRMWGKGHHGSWIIPQQVLRAPQTGIRHGLKPDYLVGGKDSGGISWGVLELKSPADKVFVRSKKGRLKFSEKAHEGVFQLLEYTEFCSKYQANLREDLSLINLREPPGLLVIGNRSEFEDSQHEEMKAAWKRLCGDRLEIRTYEALIEEVRMFVEMMESFGE